MPGHVIYICIYIYIYKYMYVFKCVHHSATSSGDDEVIDMQHATTHCNTLHHTATHCNTLQYTATRCNTMQQKKKREGTISNPYQHRFFTPSKERLLKWGQNDKGVFRIYYGSLCTIKKIEINWLSLLQGGADPWDNLSTLIIFRETAP